VFCFSSYIGVVLVYLFYALKTGEFWIGGSFLLLMFFGACIREVVRFDFSRFKRLASFVRFPRAVLIGGATGLVMLSSVLNVYNSDGELDSYLFRGAFFFCIWILVFLFFGVFYPLRSRWLAALGRRSYSIYLWHMVVIHAVVQGTLSGRLGVLKDWPILVYLIAFVPVCLVVGSLAYRWIEQPAAQLGRRIVSGWPR